MEAHRLGLMPRPVDSMRTGLTVVLLICLQVGCGEADTSPERRSQAASHEGGSGSDDKQTCRESLTGQRTSAKTVREEFGIAGYDFAIEPNQLAAEFRARDASGQEVGVLQMSLKDAPTGQSRSSRIDVEYESADAGTVTFFHEFTATPAVATDEPGKPYVAQHYAYSNGDTQLGVRLLGQFQHSNPEKVSQADPFIEPISAKFYTEGPSGDEQSVSIEPEMDQATVQERFDQWLEGNDAAGGLLEDRTLHELLAVLVDGNVQDVLSTMVSRCQSAIRDGAAGTRTRGQAESPVCGTGSLMTKAGLALDIATGLIGAAAAAGVTAGPGAALATAGVETLTAIGVYAGFSNPTAGAAASAVAVTVSVAIGSGVGGTAGVVIIAGTFVGIGLQWFGGQMEQLVDNSAGLNCGQAGNPLTVSGDGVAFPFRAAGEFVWVNRSGDESSFELQIRQGPNPDSSCRHGRRIEAAAARIGEYRVGFYPQRDRPLWIDGEPKDNSGYFWKLGERAQVIRKTGGGSPGERTYLVEWSTGEKLRIDVFEERLDLELDVPKDRRDGLEGLLGNFNGNPGDDIQLRDGTTLEEPVQWRELYTKFAESWRVRPEESLFDYREGRTTASFQDRSLPTGPRRLSDLTDEQRAYGRRICRRNGGVTDPNLLRHCVMDVGCTDDPTYMKTFARLNSPKRALEIEGAEGRLLYDSDNTADLLDGPVSKPNGDSSSDYNQVGQAACSGGTHSGGATSTGDPHLKTADGKAYDFQGVGEFVLMTSRADDPFEIQVRQEPIAGERCPTVTINTAFAAKLGSHRVGFYAKRQDRVWLDGQPLEMEAGFESLGDGHGITKLAENRYALTWPDGEYFEVMLRSNRLDMRLDLPMSRRGQLHGLLGRYNGDPVDDIRLRDGTILEEPIYWQKLQGEYADSWRISPEESLFDYQDGKSTADYTDTSAPAEPTTLEDVPEAEEASVRETCKEAGISDQTVLEDCIVDVYCSGDESYADNHAGREPPAETLEVDDSLVPGDCTVASYDGHEYAFCRNSRTWPKARTFCADRGMHLVTLADEAEEQWVLDEAYKHHEGNWAIGLNAQDEEGTFVWVDGTPLDYTNWRSGEPNDTGGEDCVEANRNGWNDVGCERSKWPFICESSP